MTDSLIPRRAALALLNAVTIEHRLLSECAALLAPLDAPQRARAQRLALSVLRAAGRADRWLKPHLKKRPPVQVQNALRLGVVEIAEGAAPHGVVNDIVALLADSKRTAAFAPLANAVLRKGADLPQQWGKLALPQLPEWLRGPLREAWGNSAINAMERAHFRGAPLDLTVKADAAAWAEKLGGLLLPTGSVRLASAGQVSALAGYDTGAWWVQDAAAALPVKLLGDVRGLRALDLCAAPGGKTMQLANAGAQVTALDLSAGRLGRVAENLARTQLQAEAVQGDALEFATGGWDVIVLDAPCSATGTIRRHPDLPQARDGAEIGDLIDLQARMIDHALTLLAPGGRLLFCTCSLLPDEGEVQIEAALERHLGLRVEAPTAPFIEDDWRSPEGGLRLRPDYWPSLGGMDGFYMAVLRAS
ncbi:ribosomal RNA small subunit methyltransferase B [Ketogulonicigenium robustum]|uniref:Ribosomal RNA small subunit methyltransferase B n=1 Tax=Ketogulonicigenium robustum TaxID=92947 RepID=A0A1W6P1V6_9RHOB|nr:transcription antitermination factor NusB [Ketogulonicigenium robustum]ARO15381.1 ribosomal RNA small subunit methyltransferase B [Ketogulonicigenium robustum]